MTAVRYARIRGMGYLRDFGNKKYCNNIQIYIPHIGGKL